MAQAVGNLLPAFGPFVLAAALVVVLVPIAIFASFRLKVVAVPDNHRHRHRRPTPLLGGVAIFLAFLGAVAYYVPFSFDTLGLLACCGLATAIFVIDDRRPLNPWVKLGLQAGVASTAILVFSYDISFLGVPGLGIVQLGLLDFPISLVWLVGMQNTVNLLDGVDGLAAGVVAIVALVLLIAAVGREPAVLPLAGALAGACAGFLFFNFNPARIFMGDSGSHFLGLGLGMLSILGAAKIAVGFSLLVPLLALAIPIADTAWAIVRRGRGRVSIAHPDTNHIHHQLLDFGLSQPETCFLFYGGTAILGSLGLMFFGHTRVLAVSIVLLVVLLSTVIGARLGDRRWPSRAGALPARSIDS